MMDSKSLDIKILLIVFWEMVIFPKFVYIIVPCILFSSLFFIPDNYDGFIAYAKTMEGTIQNKWIYDTVFFYQIFILFLVFCKSLILGLTDRNRQIISTYVRKVIRENHGGYPNTNPLHSAFYFLFLACIFIFFNVFDEYSEFERTDVARNGNYIFNFIMQFFVKTQLFIAFFLAVFVRKIEENKYVL